MTVLGNRNFNKTCDCARKICDLRRVTVLEKMRLNKACDYASKKCYLIGRVTVLVQNGT